MHPALPTQTTSTYPTDLDAQLATLTTDPIVQHLQASRERLAADPYRPLYHFSSPENLVNDPNGLCRWQQRYHLFYQFIPDIHGRTLWGHTVSDDLLHWRDLPPALYPDQESHCYSGQTLVEPNRVIAMYHGVDAGNAITTASDPLLLNWRKHPGNPVIPIVPVDACGSPYRIFDPCLWKEEDGYYALSGSHGQGTIKVDARGAMFLFHSPDLADWRFLGKLIDLACHLEAGEDGAVPNFLPIGNGKHILIFFSHARAGQYFIGTYDRAAHRFIPESHGRMNHGPWCIGSLHAPSAMVDEDGQVIVIFNVWEGKPPSGWNNVMTLPRCLRLDEDGTLNTAPIAAVESLRFGHTRAAPQTIPAHGEVVLYDIAGRSIEIEAVIAPDQAREVGLFVLRSPDGTERTRVSLYQREGQRPHTSRLQIDISEATGHPDAFGRAPETGPLSLKAGETLQLRIFLDRSIIEVFANGRQCLTLRAYPQREDSTTVSLFARGGSARLVSLDMWHLRSVWPELKQREGT